MVKKVSGRGTPVLRTDTFLTWDTVYIEEEKAYSWVSFANLSPGEHIVKWEWYEPTGQLYAESEDLSLQGNGSPSYTVWHSISITKLGDLLGAWQVKVYFDRALAFTEEFRLIRAPWIPVATDMFVAEGEHDFAVDPVRNLIYVTNDTGEPPPWTFGDFTIERPYRVYVFDGETQELLRKMTYDFRIGIDGTLNACLLYPDEVVVNAVSGRIHVDACGLYTASAGSGNLIAMPIGELGGIVEHIAVNPTNGYVYVDRFEEGRVTVVGPGPALPGAVPHLNLLFPTDTGAMAVNPNTNRVYIVGNGVVYVLDSSTNEIIATIPDVFAAAQGLAQARTTIDVNPETNRVYVSRQTVTREQVTVIDGETNSVIATVDDWFGGRIRVNPVSNRIYVEGLLVNEIGILDGYTNMPIDRIILFEDPQGYEWWFAVNPVTHRLYFTTEIGFDLDEAPEPIYVMSDEPGPQGMVINKVELNAVKEGGTVRSQWVELYNSGPSEVDVSGWTLTATRPHQVWPGLTAHIPLGTTILPGGYHIVETPDPGDPWYWLVREREVITLRDAQGRLVDWTPELTDEESGGTLETWQRFPEGQNTRSVSDWIFR
ncbi:MAG: lamin tail domain-containing protein [Dehalococcoidia bacterium]